MGPKLNTHIVSTAAESPWNNGINECHIDGYGDENEGRYKMFPK